MSENPQQRALRGETEADRSGRLKATLSPADLGEMESLRTRTGDTAEAAPWVGEWETESRRWSLEITGHHQETGLEGTGPD